MRSPFADRREDILPRTLRELIATEPQPANDRRRRRQRRTAVRRVT